MRLSLTFFHLGEFVVQSITASCTSPKAAKQAQMTTMFFLLVRYLEGCQDVIFWNVRKAFVFFLVVIFCLIAKRKPFLPSLSLVFVELWTLALDVPSVVSLPWILFSVLLFDPDFFSHVFFVFLWLERIDSLELLFIVFLFEDNGSQSHRNWFFYTFQTERCQWLYFSPVEIVFAILYLVKWEWCDSTCKPWFLFFSLLLNRIINVVFTMAIWEYKRYSDINMYSMC